MFGNLTRRQEAEAIEQFGDDLLKLCRDFCAGFSNPTVDLVCEVPDQEKLEEIGRAFQALGDRLCRECEEAEEAEDRRRDNPLEPDFRRLGQ